MYLKPVVKYRLCDYKRAIITFYIIIIAIMIGFFSITISYDTATASFAGIEMIGMNFIFIVSLTSFKEPFRMLIQNGISRKTILLGQIIWTICVSAIMSVVDKVICLVGSIGSSISGRFIVGSLLDQVYPSKFLPEPGRIPAHLMAIAFSFCLYTAVAALGYFITLLYYRMNTPMKVAVSISVPCFLFIGLPLIDNMTNGGVSYFFDRVSQLIFGVDGSNGPLSVMAFALVCSALLCGLSWLLIKKAPVKN